MIRDRKGDIGFMEAMASAMAVCIVMAAFTAFCAAELTADSGAEERPEFDWPAGGEDEEGTSSALYESAMTQMRDSGWNGVRIEGPDGTCIEIGEEEGDLCRCTGIMRVCPSAGETVPTI
ncbi:MAG: hypothetical protein ACOX8X_03980 [Methanomethylophilus sp.]|jgi:hypothetical protein